MAEPGFKTILFIAHSPDFYGADKVLYQVIEACRGNFKVHVVLPGSGEMQYRLEKFQDVELFFLELPRFSLAGRDIGANIMNFLPFSRSFKKLLSRLNPDLVYGNTVRSALPVAMARRFGYRTLVHFHEHNVPGKAGGLIAGLADRAGHRNIFVCRSALESYASFSPELTQKSSVIYNGIKPVPAGDVNIAAPKI
ncbi:MAG: glycosyltransferase, partial [Deltaproteobacteria bacterium]|nr:glycosyltransferase [Deltaproteobacteria bacterium]